ncbi:hypothetical protein AA313_de0200384 [Arthrobotrys entomopaga]|nr:hypothetical protein AA313_de0200384 [Arthrobotrys entomopaga]
MEHTMAKEAASEKIETETETMDKTHSDKNPVDKKIARDARVHASSGCIGCGTGQSACNEDCIRKIAAIRCLAKCDGSGRVPVKRLAGLRAGFANESCPAAQTAASTGTSVVNVPTDTDVRDQTKDSLRCKTGCCGKKEAEDYGTVVVQREANRVNEKSLCATGKTAGCCGYKEVVVVPPKTGDCSGCPEIDSDSGNKKIAGCCSGKRDPGPIQQKDDCCSLPNQKKAPGSSFCAEETPKSTREVCSDHLQQAFSEYSEYLRVGRCICLSVLNRLDTRCGPARQMQSTDSLSVSSESPSLFKSSGSSIVTSENSPSSLAQKSCSKSCCGKTTGGSGVKPDKEAAEINKLQTSLVLTSDKADQKSCCGKKERFQGASAVTKACQKSCCEKPNQTDEIQPIVPISGYSQTEKTCEKSCCGKPAVPVDHRATRVTVGRATECHSAGLTSLKKPQVLRKKQSDIESAAARQHVTFKVTGMTCTGCSKKVHRVLGNIDGISDIKVTFVTGVAEFTLNQAVSKLEPIVLRIERETGFKLARFASIYQTIDLRIDRTLAKGVCKSLEDLVESIEQIDQWTYRISYDPLTIGARSLLSSVPGAELAPPGNDAALANGKRLLFRMIWSTVAAAVLTIPIVVLAWSDNPISYNTRSIVSLVLATLVQGISVPEFYVGAIKALLYSRVLEMDMLVVISITSAYVYSVVAFGMTHAGYVLETGEFFETSSLLITLVLLGRLIAATAKVKAVSAVSLRSLQVQTAILVEPSGDTLEIDARLLEINDIFIVAPHCRIVTDGIVISGQSSVDESMVTGESLPVPKTIGDGVIAGTINGPSPLNIHLTRLPGENSITDIANLVENALAAKPRVQDVADKVAGYFIPVVVAIATIVFGIWVGIAIKIRGENAGGAIGIAITYAISVLAVSCPCALGLAVPMVLVIAGGVSARNGVIIKQADVIERGYKVTDVVFDKTNTITKGDLYVVHEEIISNKRITKHEVCLLAHELTRDNQHPVSLAINAHTRRGSTGLGDLEGINSTPGAGIECTWRGFSVQAGNPYWLNIEHLPTIITLLNSGMTLFCITVDSEPIAIFGLKSNIRDEAVQVVAELGRRNITCHIVSGDNSKVVKDVADTIGIPTANIASRHSPAQKKEYVQKLMSAGRIVLFCGDGTNDAVAVAQANIGVQIGTTSDVTRAATDVVLLGGLDGVLNLIDLSKRSFRRVIFNFIWSAVYNVFAILLAAGAFVKFRVPPAYAGLGEIVSVLPVIAVSLTLWKNKPWHRN